MASSEFKSISNWYNVDRDIHYFIFLLAVQKRSLIKSTKKKKKKMRGIWEIANSTFIMTIIEICLKLTLYIAVI